MSFGRSRLSQITRGTATLSAIALLLGAGLITPAQAAEGVKFTPTVDLTVAADSPLGEPVNLKVSLGAAAGEEWMQTSGADAPLSVRIDAYGEYADGAIPAESPTPPSGTFPTTTETFIADKGAGDYTFNLTNFDYNAGNYVFVASVVPFDGNNANVASTSVATPFSQPTANTRLSLIRSVVGAASGTETIPIDGVLSASTLLTGTGFNNTSADVKSVLYGPYATAPATSPTVPADAPISGTTITTFNGGYAQTSRVPVSSGGFYVWHHTIAASDGFAAFDPAFAGASDVFEVASSTTKSPVVVTDPAAGTTPAPVTVAPPAVTTNAPATTSSQQSGVVASAGTGAVFANCTEARAAGRTNILRSEADYSANLDSDSDGIGCETNGSDSAASIDGGFAQVSDVDNTPFIAGGVALVVLALIAGAAVIVRKKASVK